MMDIGRITKWMDMVPCITRMVKLHTKVIGCKTNLRIMGNYLMMTHLLLIIHWTIMIYRIYIITGYFMKVCLEWTKKMDWVL